MKKNKVKKITAICTMLFCILSVTACNNKQQNHNQQRYQQQNHNPNIRNSGDRPVGRPNPQKFRRLLSQPSEDFLRLSESDLKGVPVELIRKKINKIDDQELRNIIVKEMKFKEFSELAPTIRGSIPQEIFLKKLKKIKRVGYKNGLKKGKEAATKQPEKNTTEKVIDGIGTIFGAGEKLAEQFSKRQ